MFDNLIASFKIFYSNANAAIGIYVNWALIIAVGVFLAIAIRRTAAAGITVRRSSPIKS